MAVKLLIVFMKKRIERKKEASKLLNNKGHILLWGEEIKTIHQLFFELKHKVDL